MPINIDQVLEVFESAVDEIQCDSLRQGQTIVLPPEGELWITGDLHDHRRNFDKLLKAADLANNPQRHLILHELLHGDHIDASGAEDSWTCLYRAAELKCDFSSQVHLILANHDLAQIYGEGIFKAGLNICKAFRAAIKRDFGEHYPRVDAAITELLLALPLAVRAPNGIFVCHSLPTDQQIETFDFTIFDRPLTKDDYVRRTGHAYNLIWGRNTSPAAAAAFADKVGAKIIVTGHQTQEGGYLANGDRHLIIASEHARGCFLPLNMTQEYDMPALVSRIKRFIAIE